MSHSHLRDVVRRHHVPKFQPEAVVALPEGEWMTLISLR